MEQNENTKKLNPELAENTEKNTEQNENTGKATNNELNDRVRKAFANARKKFLFTGVEFHKAIQLSETIIIVCKGKIGSLIGKKGIIVGTISKELNSKVRIVEASENPKKVILDILGNIRVLGVNEVFTKEGTELHVVINAKDRYRLTAPKEEMEKTIKELTGTATKIEMR